MEKQRIVIGVSGASGAPVAVEVLQFLRKCESIESHLIITEGAEKTIRQECGISAAEVAALADVVYDIGDIGAAVASGSFKTAGMIVVPASMKTLAGLAAGYSGNLLLRAADVCLKERRRLVLAARETPLNNIHLRNMLTLSETGAIILPLVLAYYNRPQEVNDLTCHLAGKILDLFGLDHLKFKRWDGGMAV
ncbi:aromatic acid decarboxylase [Deltaproteobacteria bacterium Smac51]|nr:aromatic acid decarboxylase [Deltaproteobacteria bacterium Smac51]